MEFSTWELALLTVLIAVSAALTWRGLSRKLQVIRQGPGDRVRTDRPGRRLLRVAREVLLQARVIAGRPVVGLLHAAVFLGFLVFALETLNHFLEPYGLHLLRALFGGRVPVFKGVVAAFAVLVAVSIAGLAFRRFVLVRISPDPKSYTSGVVALFIFLLMATFLYAQTRPPAALARANWWLHALIILVFPLLILRSKHFHIVMAPVAIYLRTHTLGEYLPLELDLEKMEGEADVSLGLERVEQLPWKQRMDFLTCVECRRCTDHCPANLAGQELDPRAFILQGRAAVSGGGAGDPVIGSVITERALGQCTSCGACENACPVGIEHLQVLVGAKRAQALALGTGMVAADFLREVERTGNALGARPELRAKLIGELDIPLFEPGRSEYLLWLGCVWSYNPDSRPAVQSTVTILKAAGVRFGVLEEEVCVGHHSRRQGEELQFQTLARQNIEALRGADARRVVTGCPHCLHTISREYPQLDPAFRPDVVHHTQLMNRLLDSGALRLDRSRWGGTTTTFHDPCYLARYEGEHDAPRELIRAAGLSLAEMARNRASTVCCGGGNAGFASERPEQPRRVDQVRAEHVRATGAKLLVTACPECRMMLNAATERTRDVAEIVAEALAQP
ncbi:MAG: (Fe-S)-binding protein [Acidobacteria bacterium]|nr:(Fe-S)-binding protein [Acidobacteriota bacterium]